MSLVTLRPMPGRAVFIAGRRATTDDDGHFAIPDVGSTYDVVVGDPGGITFSVYLGVHRRDPLLPHRGVPTGSRRTTVQGDVSGGGNYPLAGDDGVIMSFFSDQAGGSWPLSAHLVPPELGPAYGPIPLAWNGGASISGVLTALGTFHAPDGGVSTFFAQRQETLNDGQTTFANLALAPVAGSLHVAGTIGLPPNSTALNTRLFDRLPIAGATIDLASGRSASIDDDAPVLNYPGAELCVSATAIPGSAFAQRCDLSAGNTDASLTLQAPPAFTSPTEGAAVSKDTALAWTSFNNGITVLELEGDPPSTAMPNVDVYTAGTSAGWPDLTAAGVPFPAAAAYRCSGRGTRPVRVAGRSARASRSRRALPPEHEPKLFPGPERDDLPMRTPRHRWSTEMRRRGSPGSALGAADARIARLIRRAVDDDAPVMVMKQSPM